MSCATSFSPMPRTSIAPRDTKYRMRSKAWAGQAGFGQ